MAVSVRDDEFETLVKLRLITTNLRLYRARRGKGYTVPEFAEVIGLPVTRYREIENLKRVPTEEEMLKISIALEVPAVEFLFPDFLIEAIKRNVFAKRTAELREPQIISLSQAAATRLLPAYTTEEEQVIRDVDTELLSDEIDWLLTKRLTPRQAEVLRLRFGLEDGRSRTLKAAGKEFNVTPERIRQLEYKALRRLRHPSNSRRLTDYLE